MQECIKLVGSDSKDICIVTKEFRKKLLFPQKHKAAQQLFSTLTIRTVSLAPDQPIRMISEGSCDTEDQVMLSENSALPSNICILNILK